MSPFVITIIGPPGSGKDTQGRLIAKKYNLNFLVAGDIIRRLSVLDTPLGRRVKENYNKGIPQPDEIVIRAVKEEINKMDAQKGFLLVTFPLSVVQAEALEGVLREYNIPTNRHLVIYLDIGVETVVERLSKRLTCLKCGTVYLPKDPAYKTRKCDKCGGKLISRTDDKPEIVRKRVEEYQSRMRDLKKYYAEKKRLVIINGEPSIKEISANIFKHINEYLEAKVKPHD